MKPIHAFCQLLILCCCLALPAYAADTGRPVSFTTADGGTIHGLLYGDGHRAVVLAHGAVFDKESWTPLARRLAASGWLVLALDFRGYGQSVAGSKPAALYEDILGAVRYLKQQGSDEVAVVGASMGANAAARAAIRADDGEIAQLILLAPPPFPDPDQLKGHLLFIVSQDEPLADSVRSAYQAAPEPKRLEVIEGSAHAQHIFKTVQGERLSAIIVDFLNTPATP